MLVSYPVRIYYEKTGTYLCRVVVRPILDNGLVINIKRLI